MHNHCRLFLCFLIVFQGIVLSIISWNTAPGWDEWGHLASGLFSLQYGDFSPYCVNPPLTRLIASVSVVLAGGGIDYEPLPHIAGLRTEGFLGLSYIEQQRDRCFTWIAIARTSVIPICLLGTYLIWSIGRRLYGATSAIAAASLWCFSPTVLTFGASITPDVSAAVFGLLAAWRCYIWLRLGTLRTALLLGCSVALAMLTKTTWIILPVVLIIVSVVYACQIGRRWIWRHRLLQIVVVALSCWTIVHACYDFQGMLRPLGTFDFISQTLSGLETAPRSLTPATGNRFRGTWLAAIPAMLPADYVLGIDNQKFDFELRMDSYFLGEWRDHGWWYYYLVGIFLKEPVALWVLATVAWGALLRTGAMVKRSHTKQTCQRVVLLPGFMVLILVSSQTGFNHHLRYVLPFLPCLYFLVAQPIVRLGVKTQLACLSILFCYSLSSLSIVPRSYAFFSEAIGGAKEGMNYLSHSNLDWGQDLLTVKHWIDTNPEKRPVLLVYSIPMINFRKLGVDAEDGSSWVETTGPSKPGWWIVFAHPMLEPKNQWFRKQRPDFKLSVTTSVFEIQSVKSEDQAVNPVLLGKQ